jgi:hypothetical protein
MAKTGLTVSPRLFVEAKSFGRAPFLLALSSSKGREKAAHERGKSNKQGTPQGGVISPLPASLYVNRFLKFRRLRGRIGLSPSTWSRSVPAKSIEYI